MIVVGGAVGVDAFGSGVGGVVGSKLFVVCCGFCYLCRLPFAVCCVMCVFGCVPFCVWLFVHLIVCACV